MNKALKSIKTNTILRGIIYIVSGIIIILNPAFVLQSIAYLLTAYLLLIAATYFWTGWKSKQSETAFRFSFFIGGVYTILGLAILFFGKSIISFLPIVLGVIIVISGATQLISSFDTIKHLKNIGIGLILYSLILIVLGVVLVINPFSSVLILFRIFGILLIAMGVLALFYHFYLDKRVVIIDKPR